jgi:hypothetical protein
MYSVAWCISKTKNIYFYFEKRSSLLPGSVLGPHVEHLLVGEAIRAVLVLVGRHRLVATGPDGISSNTCSRIKVNYIWGRGNPFF